MPDAMILVPVTALILPGLLAFGLGRRLRSLWPALILGMAALASGLFFLSRASGAQWNDGAAITSLFAAIGVSLPALISAAIGGVLAHARGR